MNKLSQKIFVTVVLVLLILACGIFSSCGEGELFYNDFYYKCFFLGEKSFQIEGEVFSDYTYETPAPFEYVDFRLYNKNVSPYHIVWEIPATKISESKFNGIIDITVDGIPIENGTVEKVDYNAIHRDIYFPKDFPAYALCLNLDRDKWYGDHFELWDGDHFYYYIYVGEPIDLSTTYTEKHPAGSDFSYGHNVNTYHKDFNFSKPGWYKVISAYEKIENDPKFSSGEKTKLSY
jgi:hypothetical protein